MTQERDQYRSGAKLDNKRQRRAEKVAAAKPKKVAKKKATKAKK